MNKWLKPVIICFLLVALAMAGCQPAAPTATEPTKGDVYVYVATPLSGFQANGGQTILGGVNLMADELNRAGGLLGYRVVVVPLDDESSSDVAIDVAGQIKADVLAGKKVLGVIGHLNSGQTLAAMEIYKDLPLLIITPTSSEVSISQKGYTNFFRVNANDAVQSQADARFLVEKLAAKRVAILHNDTEYGIGLAQAMADALQKLGAQVVLKLQVAEGQDRYEREIPQIQQVAPDAIFYAGYEIEAPYLRIALVQAGIRLSMLASDGAFLAATIDEAEGAAEGMYVSGFAPSPKTAVDAMWIRGYQNVEFRNPDTYSINGYSALQVLAEGAKKANSLDVGAVSQAIKSLSVKTPMGQLAFEPNGDVRNATVYIFQVKEGAFVQVYP